jgi:hypothetical protein
MRKATASRRDPDRDLQLCLVWVEEATPMQKQAWARLWRLLLNDSEASHAVGGTQNPAPVKKTDAGPSGEH